ncbi:hypothetical protein B0J14DRAFT_636069 [Halenospora varia]|nr:hypothetical protein B0J14DRAFT_636069 [Halenospora varia]
MSTDSGFEIGNNREVDNEAVLCNPDDTVLTHLETDHLPPADVCIDPESPVPEEWKLPSGGRDYGEPGKKGIIPETDELRLRDRETQDEENSQAKPQQSSSIHRGWSHSSGAMPEVPSPSDRLPARLSNPRGHTLPTFLIEKAFTDSHPSNARFSMSNEICFKDVRGIDCACDACFNVNTAPQNGHEKRYSDDSIATLTSSYHQKKIPLLPALGINTTINNKEFPTNFHTDTATTTNQIAVSNTKESHLFLSNSSDVGNPEVQVDAYEKTTELQILNVPYPQTLATDSGYASLGNGQSTQNKKEDDAQTVFTDNQELDVPGDVKKKLSTAFTGELLQNIRDVLSACYIEKEIRNALAEILKEFSIRCRKTASSKQQKDATTFVRHYRHCIAKLFEAYIKEISGTKQEESDEEEEDGANVKAQDGLSLAEKMQLWHANRPEIPKPDDLITNANPTDEEIGDIEEYTISQYSEAWKFITNGHEFRWLIGRIKTEMVLTERRETPAENIRLEILRGLASSRRSGQSQGNGCEFSTASFEIEWTLLAFLKDHYPNQQSLELASIITIVGSGVDVQTLTCAEYMRQVWPTTGVETLNALQEAVEKGQGGSYQCTTTENTQITLSINVAKVSAVVSGTDPSIAEIGQQLAWLGAALRESPFDFSMAYSTPEIAIRTSRQAKFTLSHHITRIDSHQGDAQPNGSCWHPLFRNPIIVKGYPILARVNGEKGLEIPLNMMAGLGEASRVTNFDGGLLIKGFSTMFCPTQQMKSSLLWHFLYNDDGSRMPYLSADNISGGRLSIQDVDSPFLEHSRHFLGWASSVEIHAGTKDVKYEDIEWAGSSLATAGLAIQNASLVAGKFLSGGVSFVRGIQDTPIYIGRGGGPYAQEVHSARNMTVVLYDVGEHRGWLVDGASALLHITRTQLVSNPYCESDLFRLEDFQYADSNAGVSAANVALMNKKNRNMVIFEDVETSTESRSNVDEVAEDQVKRVTKRWTYQDLVRQTYHILEQIHDYQTKMMASPTLGVRCSPREKLIGFGFMDIVDGQNELLPRVATLKASGRGWVDFTRTIRAITLLGKGFGEIIRPKKDSNKLCEYWHHVPTGKDYLVASTTTLKEISRKYGNFGFDSLELANGIYWHKPDKLFESCQCKPISKKGICDRVQVLLPPSLGTKKHPHPFKFPDGAVIFGRSKRFPWRWPSKGEPVKGETSDSELDDESGFHDSGIGSQRSTSDPASDPASDIDRTGGLSSSPSNRSPLSSIVEGAMMSGGLGENEEIQNAVDPLILEDEIQAPPPPGVIPLGGSAINFGEFEMPPLSAQTSLQVPTRPWGAKRTWDRFKEKAPQVFPTKKQKLIAGTHSLEDANDGKK